MEKTIKLISNEEAALLYGSLDERLRRAENEFGVHVSASNQKLTISGSKQSVKKAVQFFEDELDLIRNDAMRAAQVETGGGYGKNRSSEGKSASFKRTLKEKNSSTYDALKVDGELQMGFFLKGKVVQPKSENQRSYIQSIQRNDIVIGIGPAGTGKTYLAMASAIDALKHKRVSRLVLTRPAVEAGESLGFLPGDLTAKINPYLRPLHDALYDMMDFDEAARYLRHGTIEVAPLAYMRGRTLNDSFVILDEGQNCTHEQMKMFLTRLGQSSRAVVTGDITQIDLPSGKRSGLVTIQNILREIHGIKFCYLNERDVIRHKLVQEIILAYEKHDRKP